MQPFHLSHIVNFSVRPRTALGRALRLTPSHAARASLEGVSHAEFCDAAPSLYRPGGSLDHRLRRGRHLGPGRRRRLPVLHGRGIEPGGSPISRQERVRPLRQPSTAATYRRNGFLSLATQRGRRRETEKPGSCLRPSPCKALHPPRASTPPNRRSDPASPQLPR